MPDYPTEPHPREFAFPVAPGDVPYWQPGMTLRDYFAGQALVAMGTWVPPEDYVDPDGMPLSQYDRRYQPKVQAARAKHAYEQADAMLKEGGYTDG